MKMILSNDVHEIRIKEGTERTSGIQALVSFNNVK